MRNVSSVILYHKQTQSNLRFSNFGCSLFQRFSIQIFRANNIPDLSAWFHWMDRSVLFAYTQKKKKEKQKKNKKKNKTNKTKQKQKTNKKKPKKTFRPQHEKTYILTCDPNEDLN